MPFSEKEWREKLDPVHMVQARVIEGGPQASEMQRMLSETAARHKGYLDWTKSSHEYLDAAEERLERDFHELSGRVPVIVISSGILIHIACSICQIIAG